MRPLGCRVTEVKSIDMPEYQLWPRAASPQPAHPLTMSSATGTNERKEVGRLTTSKLQLRFGGKLATGLDKANTVAVGILHVHLSIAPGLLDRL